LRSVSLGTGHFFVSDCEDGGERQVGYLINDLILMVQHPAVGGGDMIVHHIVCIAFWSLGVMDRLPPSLERSRHL